MSIKNATLGLLLTLLFATPLLAQDIAGASDHPLVSRYEGSTIQYYYQREFAPYTVVIGQTDGKPDAVEEVEGQLTSIVYAAPKGRSAYEVMANYKQQLKAAGAEMLFSCAGDNPPNGCDHYNKNYGLNFFSNVFSRYSGDSGDHYLPVSNGAKDQNYLAAKLGGSQPAYVVVGTRDSGFPGGATAVVVEVIEVQGMDEGMVSINADALKEALDTTGKVAVYDILFDTGKAVVKPESNAALEQIAQLLNNDATLQLHVVGHTDATGSFDNNKRLSEHRARAVVEALTSNHGISAQRLTAHGVGPLAPVASNDNEAGRAKNRRVELVKQLQ